MKNVRISSKALAAVLALLMVLSTVIALPAAAVEGAPAVTNKNVFWSYDFTDMEAMDASTLSQYAIDNDLFVLSNTSDGASTRSAKLTKAPQQWTGWFRNRNAVSPLHPLLLPASGIVSTPNTEST